MNIQAVFTWTVVGTEKRLFINGTAYAENWAAEYSDWQTEHISITGIEDEAGEAWPVSMFSVEQIREMKTGLLLAARRKSAMNPKFAANLRNLLNLPKFDAKCETI